MLFQNYPELAQLDPAGQEIIDRAHSVTFPAGTVLFRQGDQCKHFILVTSGRVKVLGRNPSGREIVLYRIENHGTCVLTTSCLMGHQPYPAEGITETNVNAYLIPQSDFEKALNSSPTLRSFVFSQYANPLTDVIQLVQSIAFESIEQRLVEFLLTHTDASMQITLSHQKIADELGTAREVVSRQLKKLEQQQLIRLERGCIHICDLAHLHSVT